MPQAAELPEAAIPTDAPEGTLAVREGRALGSRLHLVAADSPRIDAAWLAVVDEFAAVDEAMSRFREDSEITRLNRAGAAASISRRLRIALTLTDRARRATGGRFDPRVLRALDRLGFGGAALARDRPANEAGGDAFSGETSGDRPSRRASTPVLERDGGGVRLATPVDLGGIGKGLALRWAAEAAEDVLGSQGFLLDAGGDIVTRDAAPGSQFDAGWSIGIEDPLGGVEPVATCVLRGRMAIATSSTRVARHEGPAGPVHHLLDPATGQPGGAGLLAVTVAWPDPAWAEVWSKALFLAGAGGIAGEARRRGLTAWWIDAEGELSMSPAARVVTPWVRAEAERAYRAR